MPSDSTENNLEQKSEQDTKREKKKRGISPIFDLSPTLRILIYIAVVGCVGQFGNSLLNSRPKPVILAWSLIFVGVVLTGIILRLELRNHKKRHKMPNWLPNASLVVL